MNQEENVFRKEIRKRCSADPLLPTTSKGPTSLPIFQRSRCPDVQKLPREPPETTTVGLNLGTETGHVGMRVSVADTHVGGWLRISHFKRLRAADRPPPRRCHGACPGISRNGQGDEGVPGGALVCKPEKVPPVCLSLLGSSQSVSYNTPTLTGPGTRNGTYQGPRPPCPLSPHSRAAFSLLAAALSSSVLFGFVSLPLQSSLSCLYCLWPKCGPPISLHVVSV